MTTGVAGLSSRKAAARSTRPQVHKSHPVLLFFLFLLRARVFNTNSVHLLSTSTRGGCGSCEPRHISPGFLFCFVFQFLIILNDHLGSCAAQHGGASRRSPLLLNGFSLSLVFFFSGFEAICSVPPCRAVFFKPPAFELNGSPPFIPKFQLLLCDASQALAGPSSSLRFRRPAPALSFQLPFNLLAPSPPGRPAPCAPYLLAAVRRRRLVQQGRPQPPSVAPL